MKKICYVVTIPVTIKSFFIPQLKYLTKHGFDVSVICSNDGFIKDDLGNTIKYIPVDIPRGVSISGSIKASRDLKKIFKKEQFDLIQYSTPNAALYASIAAKSVGCKIRNYHLMGLRYLGAKGAGKFILKTIERITCINSTHIECVSKSNLDLSISENLFPRSKGTVVWNGSTGGVDLNRFDYSKRLKWRTEARNELGYNENDFVFGFAGRITRDKGINELLEAFFNLKDDSKLLLVGSIEDESSLNQDLFNKAKNSNEVKIHPAVTDIERYYTAMDVLVLPSYREGFGNVVIEAGAVGTPAIVSNISGPMDTIDVGNTALTVEVKDADDLAIKMRAISNMDYQQMGKNAVIFAREKFDSDILCEKILERKNNLFKQKQ